MNGSKSQAVINLAQAALNFGGSPATEQLIHMREALEAIIKICGVRSQTEGDEYLQVLKESGEQMRPLVEKLLPELFRTKQKVITLIASIENEAIRSTLQELLPFLAVDQILLMAVDSQVITQAQYEEICLAQQRLFSAYNFGEKEGIPGEETQQQ